jgi:hypothetical protein
MVTNFKCTHCKVKFSVGWFHYHNFDSGYGSESLLVCESCGAQHAIEIALSGDDEEFNHVCEVDVVDYDKKGKQYLLIEVRKRFNLSLGETLKYVNATPFKMYDEMTEKGAQKAANRLHNRGIRAEVKVYDKRKNPFFGLNKRDRLLIKNNEDQWVEIKLANDQIDNQRLIVERLRCANCGAIGSLKAKWDEQNTVCPSCKNNSLLNEGSWLT